MGKNDLYERKMKMKTCTSLHCLKVLLYSFLQAPVLGKRNPRVQRLRFHHQQWRPHRHQRSRCGQQERSPSEAHQWWHIQCNCARCWSSGRHRHHQNHCKGEWTVHMCCERRRPVWHKPHVLIINTIVGDNTPGLTMWGKLLSLFCPLPLLLLLAVNEVSSRWGKDTTGKSIIPFSALLLWKCRILYPRWRSAARLTFARESLWLRWGARLLSGTP